MRERRLIEEPKGSFGSGQSPHSINAEPSITHIHSALVLVPACSERAIGRALLRVELSARTSCQRDILDKIRFSTTLVTTSTSLRYAAAAMALAILMPAQPALARTPAPPPVPQEATQPTHKPSARPDAGPAPSDAELDRFAQAVVDVGNVKRAARPKIENAPSEEDRTKEEQATVKAIKAAIRGDHLSVHRYLQIVAYVQAHPAAQRKVVALMKQLMPPLPPQQLN